LSAAASRQTHKQGNNKNNEGNEYRKNTNGNVQSEKKAAKQNPSSI
jgi:hypothetical protein